MCCGWMVNQVLLTFRALCMECKQPSARTLNAGNSCTGAKCLVCMRSKCDYLLIINVLSALLSAFRCFSFCC